MKHLTKILFAAAMLFAFSLAGTLQAQTTMAEFATKWDHGKQFTLSVLEAMPDSGMDYKTDPEAMSFKEQIHHIASAIVGISQGLLKGGDASDLKIDVSTASREELAAFVEKAYEYGKSAVVGLSESDRAEVINAFGNDLTRRQVIAMMDDHSTHHRGAAIAYLRSNGVTPPAFVGF
ncbi:DinB family protein [Algoriphagus namhaensis]